MLKFKKFVPRLCITVLDNDEIKAKDSYPCLKALLQEKEWATKELIWISSFKLQTMAHNGRGMLLKGDIGLPLAASFLMPTYASRLAGSPTVTDQVRRP